RPIARQLILVTCKMLHGVAEPEIVRDVEPREVRLGRSGGHPRQFSIGWIGQPIDVAKSASARNLRIEVKLRVVRQAKAKEQRGGKGDVALGIILQAQRARIGGVEGSMMLANGSCLIVQIPILGRTKGWDIGGRSIAGLRKYGHRNQ